MRTRAVEYHPVAEDPFENLANGDPHGSPDDDWYEAERRFKDAAP